MSEKNEKPYRKLASSKHLKRLMNRYFLTIGYLRFGRPIAWVTSGAPVELIRACGFLPVYPENYGAICGASKAGQDLCQIAEGEGYSIDLCSYARANIGSMFNSEKAPGGGLPAPDCVVAASNVCNTLVKWFELVAAYFKVPYFVIDIPYQFEAEAAAFDDTYITQQLTDMITFLTSISKKTFSQGKYLKILKYSSETIRLWKAIRETGKHRPSPVNAPDLFIHMAPIVSLRGSRGTLRYYKRLHRELDTRIEQGIGAIKQERFRLLWDNIAIWFNLFDFFNFFSRQGACFVVSTYTDAWSGEWDENEDPIQETVRIYRDAYLNLSQMRRAEMMINSVKEYAVDGIIMHSGRTCKPYSLGQAAILEKVTAETGVPGILIDADMVDPRFYTDAQVKNRLQAFIELLETRT
ncbi:2-hydroxyacyl-CoA dehydratase subunit D [candidate division CSSED10-310 bacterium]|uniref:2-hydroxyacyl-CoA dehydratase subunit D n=1 Tax=candidate division CSSED10-310 bacterium TaxID=2855610 RepID=A0ABV6YY42_UNCC1